MSMRADLPVSCLRIALMAGSLAAGLSAAEPALRGILHKPIPERLVVLTFDDGCISHATHVAPLLEEHRFGATFYVCKPGTFTGRRDWYMTESRNGSSASAALCPSAERNAASRNARLGHADRRIMPTPPVVFGVG